MGAAAPERCEQRAGEGRLEVAVGKPLEAVLEGDGLALLGQLQTPGRPTGRLRSDGAVRRSPAAAGAPAAAVKDRQLDAAVARDGGELLLRAVDRPLRREVAAVLARVRVTDHHLHRLGSLGKQLVDDRRGRHQVVDRLEERHHLELGQPPGAADVVGRRRSRDDEARHRLGSVRCSCACGRFCRLSARSPSRSRACTRTSSRAR